MKTQLVCIIVFCLLAIDALAQRFFMCFTNDSNPKLALMVGFDAKTEKASFVKYKGQHEAIPLSYIKKRIPNAGYATTETTYLEKYKGKQTGTYIFTHSGNWVYLKYIRKEDNKKFTFTINNDLSVENGEYRTTPCY